MKDGERSELLKQIEDLQAKNANLKSEIDNYLEILIDVVPDVWDDGYMVEKNHRDSDSATFPKERRYHTCMAAIDKI